MKKIVGAITWASWHYFWYSFAIMVLVIGLVVWRYIKKKRAFQLLTHRANRGMLLNFSLPKQLVKGLLWFLGVLFLGCAFLQPQWDKKEDVVEQLGRDVVIALDVSRSMLAQDYNPSRLEFAKQKIKKLVSLLSSERVGLILFSGTAFVQCPLTQDIQAFSLFLDTVDSQTVSSGSTALDGALAKALDMFKRLPSRQNKLLVLFTDGEDFSSDLASKKEQAQQMGLHIFTLGIGTCEGAPIPIIDAHGDCKGHEQDASGAIVMSKLNEGILRTLADDVGGTYVQVSKDDGDIHKIASCVEQFEKELFDDKKVARLEEQYPWFAGAAFICFLCEWIL